MQGKKKIYIYFFPPSFYLCKTRGNNPAYNTLPGINWNFFFQCLRWTSHTIAAFVCSTVCVCACSCQCVCVLQLQASFMLWPVTSMHEFPAGLRKWHNRSPLGINLMLCDKELMLVFPRTSACSRTVTAISPCDKVRYPWPQHTKTCNTLTSPSLKRKKSTQYIPYIHTY